MSLLGYKQRTKIGQGTVHHSLFSQRILTPRELEIVQHRFGLFGFEETNIDTLGERLGLSRSYTFKNLAKALKKLKADPAFEFLLSNSMDLNELDQS